MIKKKSFSTVIDLGNYKLRLAIIDKHNEIIFYISELVERNNSKELKDTLSNLIKKAEKKLSNHIDEVILVHDSKNIKSIDLSLKKEINNNDNLEKIYISLFWEAQKLVEYSHSNYKILNCIITNCILDGNLVDKLPKKQNYHKEIIVSFKFICILNDSYNKIKNSFTKNNIEIKNIFCSSYIKSINYLKKFRTEDVLYFLDIGYEKSTLNVFKSKRLHHISSIPVGGNHITKDIANLLKINLDESEELKKLFNRSEEEFSFNDENNQNSKMNKNHLLKKIPVDLLKKIILARVQEIIELSFKNMIYTDVIDKNSLSNLILVGDGSKIFDKNSFYFDKKFQFGEINFLEENDPEICQFAYDFYLDSITLQSKVDKKQGLFSRFFNLFKIN